LTLGKIEQHARRRPQAPAVLHEGREITYEVLARDVRCCIHALRGCGVSRGERVGIGCSDSYRHWLLLLALEQLGAVNASLAVPESFAALLGSCDRVISEQAFAPGAVRQPFLLTGEWFSGVLSGNDARLEGMPVLSDGDLVRLSRTSATTGSQLLIPLDRRFREASVRQYEELLELDESARVLVSLPMLTTLSLHLSKACVQRGGTVVFSPREGGSLRAIREGGITHAFLLPWELSSIADQLPARPGTPPVLRAYATGAAVSAELRDKVLARLARSFTDLYGTNEMSYVAAGAALDPDGFGRVLPGFEVQAVDDQDRPVPAGRLGRIRIRSDFMATGYFGDPAASAEFFRNGWFYPGDLGEVRGEIRSGMALRLLGRNADVLNAGGIKFAADHVEAVARRMLGPGVEAAACTVPGPDGVEVIWIAVRGAITDEALRQSHMRIQTSIGFRCRVVRIKDIPRDETGKVARRSIQHAIAESRALRDPGAP
jgi:acyl-CoA synthetase (AMP-forming)/AMP-acid ligase II